MNNLYNTVFWALVDRGGVGRREAEERLKGTVSGVKHEVLWGLGINYAREEEVWRRGSVVFREVSRCGSLGEGGGGRGREKGGGGGRGEWDGGW